MVDRLIVVVCLIYIALKLMSCLIVERLMLMINVSVVFDCNVDRLMLTVC